MKNPYFVITLILLSVCGGYDGPDTETEQGTQGVQVTATVPYAHESIQDIIDRENECPLPPQGDRVIPRRHR